VNVTTAQSSGSGSHNTQVTPVAPRKRSWWRGIWGALVGLAGIVGTLVAIAALQGWKL
jgi:hypothetical protein